MVQPMAQVPAIHNRSAAYFRELQDRICEALAGIDGLKQFQEADWQREGGGGGRTRVLVDGADLQKGGVNCCEVYGNRSRECAAQVSGEGLECPATGISLVLHPRNPKVPTVHANFRFLTKGDKRWFGGGADLTPYYPNHDDVVHF